MKGIKNDAKGFTLLELLVVVLIIGILASIALPQYQMAVTKAKVASMLPLMRRWKDALAEYKLQHNSTHDVEDAADLGVNWPSDWTDRNGEDPCGDNLACKNDKISCITLTSYPGPVTCSFYVGGTSIDILMFQPDEPDYGDAFQNKLGCQAWDEDGAKICKALGGKFTNNAIGEDYTYILPY